MNIKTKQRFIIALISIILSLGICLFLLYEIRERGLSLEGQIKILNENAAKEVSYANLNRRINETEQERQEISSIFLSNEREAFDLLSEIETMAPSLGLSLKTKDVGNYEDKEKNIKSVVMSFEYFGHKEAVMGFTKLMENIPYHSSVESLSLKEIANNDFEGKITIRVTIQPS